MTNVLSEFPGSTALIKLFRDKGDPNIQDVNAHIHSPYSFSAFYDLEQAFRMAREEGIFVLGINDFNTTQGYPEFYSLSRKYKIFPLFNIEFMGLLKEEQSTGIRINDPSNPGRIYFSGKGLDYPVKIGKNSGNLIDKVISESHLQMEAMTCRLNDYLSTLEPGLKIDFEELRRDHTMGMVRERHIARALRLNVFDRFKTEGERLGFLFKLYGRKEPSADLKNIAAVENEIRSRLLKSGGIAFVEENPEAFLGLEQIISIIRDAGGIPCYPVLLDDVNGRFTEFESDMESLHERLMTWGVSCIELIPGRNDLNTLKRFVSWFREKGFIILFGTEHNTPSLDPIRVSARGGEGLDNMLRSVSWEGACNIAAHQYLRAKGSDGYSFSQNGDNINNRDGFAELGKAVIFEFTET